MNSELQRLFERAVDLTESEREDFLALHCTDPALRRELDLLLMHDQGAQTFLGKIVSSEATSALQGLSPAIGQRLGPYRLVSIIGKGGMGTVYFGERADGKFQQRVAIKVLDGPSDMRPIGEQLQQECRILAALEHPNIARVLDADLTDPSFPYFVMEYVDGQPIDRYCEEHKLSVRERLRLLLPVCDAVHLAHQKLIVHRDLKPDNILVTEQGIPKLLDFGIAKVLSEVPVISQNSATRVLTPEYASPEQALGQPITTATDVYCLGAVLYKLLTGRAPHALAEKSPVDIIRGICDDEVRKPSELRRELAGDADAVLLKALHPDPQQRYRSADQFAADLERWLEGKPVLAVAPSLTYRARKFARRYSVALATATVIALVLMAAAVISIRAGIHANREAAVAEAVNEFLQTDLLAQAGTTAQSVPDTKPDPDLKVRTTLDRAAERIEGKFAKQPEVEASIRDTIGWTYLDLGLYAEAQKQLKRAVELRRRALGAENAKTLKSMSRLGWVAYMQNNYAEADALENEALRAQRGILGPEHPDTLTSMNFLANIYRVEGKFAQAEALLAQTFEIQRRVLGTEHPETLNSMTDLASVYNDEGKYAQSEELKLQTLEIQKRVLGPQHPSTLRTMSSLALAYEGEAKYPQAEALLTQTLEIEKRVLGPEHRDTLLSMHNLALVYLKEGKYPQAERLWRQTLDALNRVMGPDSPIAALVTYDMGCLAARRGDKDEAIARLSQSVDHGLLAADDLGMGEDTDLNSLHSDLRFEALVAHAKQVAEAKQKIATTETPK